MKKTKKITLCAVCSALSVMVMLLGYFPYFTYAVPAVAGLFVMIPLIEIGVSYAFATYFVSSLLVLVVAEPETKVLYLLLFGFYPILKALIEKFKKTVLEWAIKIIVFSTSVLASYFVLKLLTDIQVDDFGTLGKYGAIIFLVLCYIAFVLYDIAISRVAVFYMVKVRPKFSMLLK